jgi:hypothetical protein
MSLMPDFDHVPVPHHPPSEFLSHDAEARTALAPLIETLLDRLVMAGWDGRTAASALMFHAAAQVSALSRGGQPQ